MTPSPPMAVGDEFRLPHNTEWTMADEWAVTERQCRNMSYRTEVVRSRREPPRVSAHAVSNWTDAMVEDLRALWFAGASCSAIARQMGHGLTKNSIAGKVRRIGLPQRKYQAPRKVA